MVDSIESREDGGSDDLMDSSIMSDAIDETEVRAILGADASTGVLIIGADDLTMMGRMGDLLIGSPPVVVLPASMGAGDGGVLVTMGTAGKPVGISGRDRESMA